MSYQQRRACLLTEVFSVEVDVSLGALFDTQGKRNKKKFPDVQPLGKWDGSKARAVLSKDGVLLLAAFPSFLQEKAHVCPSSAWPRVARSDLLSFS